MNSDRKQANLNDRIIAMHTNKTAATKVLIESAQYFINHARDENPLKEDCMEDLVHLRKDLQSLQEHSTKLRKKLSIAR
jgi:hypothetical protein